VSDGIIDLTAYMRDRDDGGDEDDGSPRGAFALWGADGERSRFALPLWRTIYLAGGGRGGIVWTPPGGTELRPFVVLDLEQDPPRVEFDLASVDPVRSAVAPTLDDGGAGGGVTVFLGSESERRWYLVILDGTTRETLRPRDREDILFLAGECAGLLFLRDFASQADRTDQP